MILTCEQCETRFMLSDSALGRRGRKVRCSRCQHEWFQEPEEGAIDEDESVIEDDFEIDLDEPIATESDSDDALSEDEVMSDDDFFSADEEYDEELDEPEEAEGAEKDEGEDLEEIPQSEEDAEEIPEIPESVRPLPDEKDPLSPGTITPQTQVVDASGKGRLVGFGAAGVVFLMIFAFLLALKGPLTGAIPEMAGLYALVGMQTKVEGEDLILDRVKVLAINDGQGGMTVKLTGDIVNLKDETVKLPVMQASLRKKGGEGLSSWPVALAHETIGPHEEMSFETKGQEIPEGAEELNVRFVLKMLDVEETHAEETPEEEVAHNAPAHEDSHGDAHH